MKKKEKKMILSIIIIGIILIGIIYFSTRGAKNEETSGKIEENNMGEEFVQNLENGTKLNTSTKLQEKKKLEGLEVGNIQLTHNNGTSILLADVVNTSSSETELMAIVLTLLDESGKKLEEIDGLLPPLQPRASTQLNMGMTADYANAYDFTIVKK